MWVLFNKQVYADCLNLQDTIMSNFVIHESNKEAVFF